MSSNIKMGKFLERNILDTISRKYKYEPNRSLIYLNEVEKQLEQVKELVLETKGYMDNVISIREKQDLRNQENFNFKK
jgi:hypothetical protein